MYKGFQLKKALSDVKKEIERGNWERRTCSKMTLENVGKRQRKCGKGL